jgi:alpha-tubulin suppressor-like RCC1 family protein
MILLNLMNVNISQLTPALRRFAQACCLVLVVAGFSAAADSPDLVVTSISASPSIIAPGDTVTIKGAVKNRGRGDAGYFRTGMYLSTDPVVGTNDVRIGSPKGNETESLKPGGVETIIYGTNLIITAPGVYYLGAVADRGNQVYEANEINNSRAGNRILVAGSEPVASGLGHSLALKPDGSLWAWGTNSEGQLGDGTTEKKDIPVRIGEDNKWVAISAGLKHSLALKSDGTLWAWGNNSHGQLGDGSTKNRTGPVRIGKDTKWVAVEAGDDHSVGLKSDGTLWAWGRNSNGQLGDGTKADKTAPVRIGRDAAWARIAAGAFHTVALQKDMTLWVWGNNSHGQLGDGATTDKTAPIRIGMGARWACIAAGAYHTVALNWCADCGTTFTLWAWGANEHGQLGDGATEDKASPVQIGTDTTWTKISAGSHHTVALRKGGALWAWGRNNKGQLGDGTTSDKAFPVRIGSEATWVSISGGAMHTLALKADDSAWSWGGNNHGQLGDGLAVNRAAPFQFK